MLHLPAIITDLTIILASAAIVTVVFKKLNQPVVLGYIIAGLLVGPSTTFLPSITDVKTINIWAEIGVIFLLFGLGLEFSFKKLKEVGGPASITGIIEILTMLFIGYITGKILGWGEMDSIFLGGILSVSSTTIIIRAFEETRVKAKKFASIVLGVLIIEDLVAILLLVLLSTIAVGQNFMGTELIYSSLKLAFFLIIWFLAGIFLLPSLFRLLRRTLNDEMLLVISIALCLIMVSFATKVGFSPALGAFIMGSLLAETSEGKKIEKIVEPVRDLFAAIFFVSVGMLIDPTVLVENWQNVLIITVITIIGKILSSGFGALLSGQPLKSSVQIGFSLAQIGEFSFIIATLGLSLGVISDFLYPLAVAVSVITTFTTPYLIKSSERFAGFLEDKLPSKIVQSIYQYSTSTQAVVVSGNAKKAIYSFNLKLLILVVLLIGITAIGREFILIFFLGRFENTLVASTLAFIVTFFISAPFLWALTKGKINDELYAFTPTKPYIYLPYALSFFRYAVTAIILSIQLYIFSSSLVASFIFLGLSILTISYFSNHLSGVYNWFEETFVKNLHHTDEKSPFEFSILPWQAHLATYDISPLFPHIGKSLESLKVREKYGVTIVLIERGSQKIKAPKGDNTLYPFDKISVIGTDEQFVNFREFIESKVDTTTDEYNNDNYILHGFVLKEDSPFIGKSIKDSGLREVTDGLVVALERHSIRIINPISSEKLEENDLLWVVGDREKIKKLLKT